MATLILRNRSKSKPYDGLGILSAQISAMCLALQMPQPEYYFFRRARRWQFDLAWPELLLAVEYEGQTWRGGRHVTGQGFEDDCQKYDIAAFLGWTVLRFTAQHVRRGWAFDVVREAYWARLTSPPGQPSSMVVAHALALSVKHRPMRTKAHVQAEYGIHVQEV